MEASRETSITSYIQAEVAVELEVGGKHLHLLQGAARPHRLLMADLLRHLYVHALLPGDQAEKSCYWRAHATSSPSASSQNPNNFQKGVLGTKPRNFGYFWNRHCVQCPCFTTDFDGKGCFELLRYRSLTFRWWVPDNEKSEAYSSKEKMRIFWRLFKNFWRLVYCCFHFV